MNEFLVAGLIPARLASTRLPDKLLKLIRGKSVLQRVYEQCKKARSLDRVEIITDHQSIIDHASSFGVKALMSKREHDSGTDRIAEYAESYTQYSHVINIQGDEPFIDPYNIDRLVELFRITNCDVATLAIKSNDQHEIRNPNIVKVVTDNEDTAMYFSRAPIPYFRDPESGMAFEWKRHIGIYGFKREVLLSICKLPIGTLERIERLEQLRWLQSGYRIKVDYTSSHANGIDTLEDLEAAIRYAETYSL